MIKTILLQKFCFFVFVVMRKLSATQKIFAIFVHRNRLRETPNRNIISALFTWIIENEKRENVHDCCIGRAGGMKGDEMLQINFPLRMKCRVYGASEGIHFQLFFFSHLVVICPLIVCGSLGNVLVYLVFGLHHIYILFI